MKVDSMVVDLIDKDTKVQITEEEGIHGLGIYNTSNGKTHCSSFLITDFDSAKALLGAIFTIVQKMDKKEDQ